jgi:hypothetical protein
MDSWFSADNWLPSIEKFFKVWGVVRICPERISAPNEELSFNVLTLAISLVIFLLARVSVAGSNADVGIVFLAMVVSVCIVFGTGYVTRILQPGARGAENAPKWGAFFVMVWLTSLLLLIIFDALPFWMGHSRATTVLIDSVFGPGNVPTGIKDTLRATLFGGLALSILVLKTRLMDPDYKFIQRCALVTLAVGLFVNTCLLSFFIYGHVI